MVSLRAHSGNRSNALWVNWARGAGNLSGYLLTLYKTDDSQRAVQQLGSEVTECVFSDLVPGRLYRVEVLSLSGELSNRVSTLGRTGEILFFLFKFYDPKKSLRVLESLVTSHLYHPSQLESV